MKSPNAPSIQAKHRRPQGFTAVEVMLVTTIVASLIAITVPTTNSILKANQITTATQIIVDHLSAARQTAITQNRMVEVRFYQFHSPDNSIYEGNEVRAVQSMIYDEGNAIAEPLGEVRYLPDGIVVSADETYSSLIQASREKNAWTVEDPKLGLARGIETNYTTYRLRFRPDGSTDLGPGTWFLTVHSSSDATNASHGPPPNHATVHIDRHNGSLRLYRPN